MASSLKNSRGKVIPKKLTGPFMQDKFTKEDPKKVTAQDSTEKDCTSGATVAGIPEPAKRNASLKSRSSDVNDALARFQNKAAGIPDKKSSGNQQKLSKEEPIVPVEPPVPEPLEEEEKEEVKEDDTYSLDAPEPDILPTKSIFQKFKQLEQNPNAKTVIKKRASIDTQPTEATKDIRSKWKEFEKNPEQQKKLNADEEEENVTDSNIVNRVEQRANTKEIKEQFLRRSTISDTSGFRKLTPKEELEELARRAPSGIYENVPISRVEGVVKHGDSNNAEPIAYSTQRIRQQFSEYNADDSTPKTRAPIKITEDYHGVFENDPAQLDSIAKCNEAMNDEIFTGGKWATDAKMRFMEEVKKTKEKDTRDKSRSEKVDNNENDVDTFTAEARRMWLQKQHSDVTNAPKSPPKKIDIWSDQSGYSGVFENKPAARDPTIVREYEDEEIINVQLKKTTSKSNKNKR